MSREEVRSALAFDFDELAGSGLGGWRAAELVYPQRVGGGAGMVARDHDEIDRPRCFCFGSSYAFSPRSPEVSDVRAKQSVQKNGWAGGDDAPLFSLPLCYRYREGLSESVGTTLFVLCATPPDRTSSFSTIRVAPNLAVAQSLAIKLTQGSKLAK